MVERVITPDRKQLCLCRASSEGIVVPLARKAPQYFHGVFASESSVAVGTFFESC